ncbi:hypothetical protein QOT17_018024 [Balamuthia mandrillaris]
MEVMQYEELSVPSGNALKEEQHKRFFHDKRPQKQKERLHDDDYNDHYNDNENIDQGANSGEEGGEDASGGTSLMLQECFQTADENLFLHVLCHLGPKDLCSLCQVSRQWCMVASSDFYWKRLVKRDIRELYDKVRQEQREGGEHSKFVLLRRQGIGGRKRKRIATSSLTLEGAKQEEGGFPGEGRESGELGDWKIRGPEEDEKEQHADKFCWKDVYKAYALSPPYTVGDCVEVLDSFNIWSVARVFARIEPHLMLIHFEGWGGGWYYWLHLEEDAHLIRPLTPECPGLGLFFSRSEGALKNEQEFNIQLNYVRDKIIGGGTGASNWLKPQLGRGQLPSLYRNLSQTHLQIAIPKGTDLRDWVNKQQPKKPFRTCYEIAEEVQERRRKEEAAKEVEAENEARKHKPHFSKISSLLGLPSQHSSSETGSRTRKRDACLLC